MKREILCINCPMGCRMEITIKCDKITSIEGNACQLGQTYAQQEITSPCRVLTANMRAKGCRRPFSVKSDIPIPKKMLIPCAIELKRHHPAPPIAMNDIIIENILNTGCNIISTTRFINE